MNRIQKRIKKLLIPTILLALFLYVYGDNVGEVSVAIEQLKETSAWGEILKGDEIGQSFYSHENNLNGFSLKLATFARTNKGNITIGIRKMGKKSDIYSISLKAESVLDNQFYDLRFPPIKYSKDNTYYIYVRSEDGIKGQAITSYMSVNDEYKEGQLFVNGKQQSGDLVFRVFYNRSFYSMILNS